MDDEYYLPHGPLHEQHNRMVPEMATSSSEYLSYSLMEYPSEKIGRKNLTKFKQQHHRSRTCSSKSKTQITEREAKEAIMRGLVTETNDIDVTKLSGKTNALYLIILIEE